MPKKVGLCINFGGCGKAKAREHQEADANNFICEECGKPLKEVPGARPGGGKTGGGKGPNWKLIGGIAAAVVVLGGVGAFLATNLNKADTEVTGGGTTGGGTETGGTETGGGAETGGETTTGGGTETGGETTGGGATSATTLNLGAAKYDGPISGGKAHGFGGELVFTKAYTLDLKKADGSKLELQAGDKIVNCKFNNGYLQQGELNKKNGERLYLDGLNEKF